MKRVAKSAPLGASLIVLSSVFYASYGIWTTLMGNFFGGYTASVIRSVLVLLVLVPIAVWRRQLARVRWLRHGGYFLGLILSSVVVWGPLYFAILNAGVGLSLAVAYASIVIGMFFFGWLLAGERFTKDKWLSAGLGLAGLWLVFAPSFSAGLGLFALAAAALSGVGSAAGAVIVKKLPYSAAQSTIIWWAASLIANTAVTIILGESLPAIGWYAPWFFMVIFVVTSIISSWSFVKGVKLIEAGAAGILGLLEIVFGVLFGAIFFSERPNALALSGVAVIILAAAIPYIKDYNAKRGTLKG